MSVTLPKLMGRLGIDTSEFDKGMKDAEGTALSMGKRIGKGLSNIGGVVVAAGVAGLAAASGAAIGFIASTIGPASDMEETASKVNVVFEQYASGMIKWAGSAATAMGMSTEQALAAAGTYGNLFRAMGIDTAESSKMSMSLVQLAADLASFNNMDPTEVLDALRSGLSGETEPLKRLGVNINEVTLKNKAMQMGFGEIKGVMDPNTKALVTYALIMEQTALAQGDFERTSGGLANSQRILTATWSDFKTKMGEMFLPQVTTLVKKLVDTLNDPRFTAAISQIMTIFAGWFQQLVTNLPDMITKVEEFFNFWKNNKPLLIGIFAALSVAVVAWGVTTAAAAWAAMVPFLPVIAILLAIIAVVTLVAAAWKNDWGGIRTFITNLWNNTLKPAFEALINWFKVAIPAAIAFVKQVIMGITTAFDWVVLAIQNIGAWFVNLWNGIVTVFTAVGQFLFAVFVQPWIDIYNFLSTWVFPIFTAIGGVIAAIFEVAFTAIRGFWQNILKPAFEAIGNFLTGTLGPIFSAVWNAISTAVNFVINLLVAGVKLYLSILVSVWQFLVSFFQPIFQAIADFWQNTFVPLIEKISSFIVDVLIKAFVDVYTWIKDKIIGVFERLGNLVQRVVGFFQDLAKAIRSLGDKLPDWLTPGSPTPLEIGLLGVGRAMNKLSDQALPTFSSELELTPINPSIAGFSAGSDQPTATSENNGSDKTQEVLMEIRFMMDRLPSMLGLAMKEAMIGKES